MTLRLTDRKPYEKELDCYTENAIKTYIYTDGHWTALQSRTEGTTQNVTEHTVMTDREVQEITIHVIQTYIPKDIQKNTQKMSYASKIRTKRHIQTNTKKDIQEDDE